MHRDYIWDIGKPYNGSNPTPRKAVIKMIPHVSSACLYHAITVYYLIAVVGISLEIIFALSQETLIRQARSATQYSMPF